MSTTLKYLILAWLLLPVRASGQAQTFDILRERNGLINVFARLKAGNAVTIAYLASSVSAGRSDAGKTVMSWRELTTDWFRRQYPQSRVAEVDAFTGNAGSDVEAFRVQRDIIDKKPDLVFIELAVNDLNSPTATIDPALEGIVRRIRIADATAEICFVYTLDKSMLPVYKQGRLPSAIFRHEVIAEHYRISSVNIGAAAADQINTGKIAWSDFSSDTQHPTEAGNALYTDVITAFLALQSQHVNRQPVAYRIAVPLRADCWDAGESTPAAALLPPSGGWKIEPSRLGANWPSTLASAVGVAEVSPIAYPFHGDSAGVCLLAGQDAGKLEFKLDEGIWQELPPLDAGLTQEERPVVRLLVSDVKPGAHTLWVRTRFSKDEIARGLQSRILYFVANRHGAGSATDTVTSGK